MSLVKDNFTETVNGEVVTLQLKEESKNWYQEKLPEGISIDTVNQVNKFNKELLKEVATNSKDISIDVFKANSDAKKVVLNMPHFSGEQNVTVAIDRLVERPIPGTTEKVQNPEMRIIVENQYAKVGKTYMKTLTADIKEKLANC